MAQPTTANMNSSCYANYEAAGKSWRSHNMTQARIGTVSSHAQPGVQGGFRGCRGKD
jgi:hypothetical protein